MIVVAAFLIAASPFAKATERYEALDYETACPLFDQAAHTKQRTEKARALLWAGVCQGQLGRFDEARKRFHDALALKPDATLPPDAPPKVAAVFDEEQAALLPKVVEEPHVDAPHVDEPKPDPTTTTTATTPASASTPPKQPDAPMLWTGGAFGVVSASAFLVAAIEGVGAVDADKRVQAARADVNKTGDDVLALTHERDGNALVANAAFTASAISAAACAIFVGAAFFTAE